VRLREPKENSCAAQMVLIVPVLWSQRIRLKLAEPDFPEGASTLQPGDGDLQYFLYIKFFLISGCVTWLCRAS
jgi:hypothetical protein